MANIDIVDKLRVIKRLISGNYPSKDINDAVIDEAIEEIERLRGLSIGNYVKMQIGINKG